jgi:predicted TIM-barrel fold metal-dependent hydrolase
MRIDCHAHVGIELGQYLTGAFPYAQHLSDLVQDGRTQGIDRFIVFPMVTHLGMNIAALRDAQVKSEGALETVPYAWENRRLMHEIHKLFPDEGRAVLPFAMFDPARAVSEQIKALCELRCDYRIYGLKTQTTMLQSPVTSLREEGIAFVELAQEWNVPLLIHSSVLPSDIWAQAHDILDIAEQWPHVRFCLAHSCRFDRTCLERLAALPNCWFDCSAHGIHCELAVQNHPAVAPVERRFKSDYTKPAQVLCDLAEAFPDKLLWGSDAPYYSFVASIEGQPVSLRSSYEAEASYFHALPQKAQQRVGHDNTLAFLGVDSID